MEGFHSCRTAIVTADTEAVVSGRCIVWGIYQLTNTSGTDTTYEVHDGLTVAGGGSAKLFSRSTSTPACQPFPQGVLFNTGISVNKTNAGDSKLMIVYEKF